ncbi:MAG: hypothetical protein NC301_07450 [Bacteroides sp.]|nr:hypothetical protein [Bacteroides sp.]MCM1379998.1 hypothetical protein [Bacteroides sp.]MCM1446322.1 hypothetical protein [Prevotella sp.]
MPNSMDVCRSELFTDAVTLRDRYPEAVADKVIRVRELYNWYLADPSVSDSELIMKLCQARGIHRTTAYDDLKIVKTLLPMMVTASRDFHLWRANEMLMATYRKAKEKGDTRTMERVAATYVNTNKAGEREEQHVPYELIVKQPFVPTDDPRAIGIEPIPNIQEKIDAMIKKYRAETIDIDDVEFEDVDLEFDSLFPTPETPKADGPAESLL